MDSSGSVDSIKWEDSKIFVSKFIPFLKNQDIMASIVQFSQYQNLEQNFTSDWNQFNKTLFSFSRYNSGTNTQSGIVYSYDVFSKYARQDANWMLILLTDGNVDDANNFQNVLENIKQKGVIFTVIAVQDAQSAYWVKFIPSSQQLFFKVNTFSELNDNMVNIVFQSLFFDINGVSKENKNISLINFETKVKFSLLESQKLLIQGTGFLDNSKCIYTQSSENKNFTFQLQSINVTHGWCEIPNQVGLYNLKLSNKFRKYLTEQTIQIELILSELQQTPKLLGNKQNMVCEGKTVQLQFKQQADLQNNQTFVTSWNQFKQNRQAASPQGCINSNQCPYNQYCANCSQCIGCLACPTLLGGVCRKIENCQKENNSIEGACGLILDPCNCANNFYPFSDSEYIEQKYQGCYAYNQELFCEIQNSNQCILTSKLFKWNTEGFYRQCLPKVDQFQPYCLWNPVGTTLQSNQTSQADYFKKYQNQAYRFDSRITKEQYIKFEIGHSVNQCQQQCEQNNDCNAFEYNNYYIQCIIYINYQGLESMFQYMNDIDTYILQRNISKIMIPSYLVDENTIECPVPSMWSQQNTLLNLTLVTKSDNLLPLSKSLIMKWSFCSNCTDHFAINFDSEFFYDNQKMIPNYNQTCKYENGLKYTKIKNKIINMYQSSKLLKFGGINQFIKYEKQTCTNTNSQQYKLFSETMSEDQCLQLCIDLNCTSLVRKSNINDYCLLWVDNTCLGPSSNKWTFTSQYDHYVPQKILWKDLIQTNKTIHNFELTINKILWQIKDQNQQKSNFRLWLRYNNQQDNNILLLDSSNIESLQKDQINLDKIQFYSPKNDSFQFQNNQFIDNPTLDLHKEILYNITHQPRNISVVQMPALNKFLKPLDYTQLNQQQQISLNNVLQIGVEIDLRQGYVQLEGVTVVITDWSLFKTHQRIIPPKNVLKCLITDDDKFSDTLNHSVFISQIQVVLNTTEIAQSNFNQWKPNEILFTLGCHKNNTFWVPGMPAKIINIKSQSDSNYIINLIHDLQFTDFISDIKLDTQSLPHYSIDDLINISEGNQLNTSQIQNEVGHTELKNVTTYDQQSGIQMSIALVQQITPRIILNIQDGKLIEGKNIFSYKYGIFISSGKVDNIDGNDTKRILERKGKYLVNIPTNFEKSFSFSSSPFSSISLINVNFGAYIKVQSGLPDLKFRSIGSMSDSIEIASDMSQDYINSKINGLAYDILPFQSNSFEFNPSIEIGVQGSINAGFFGVGMSLDLNAYYKSQVKSSFLCASGYEIVSSIGMNVAAQYSFTSRIAKKIELLNCVKQLSSECIQLLNSERRILNSQAQSQTNIFQNYQLDQLKFNNYRILQNSGDFQCTYHPMFNPIIAFLSCFHNTLSISSAKELNGAFKHIGLDSNQYNLYIEDIKIRNFNFTVLPFQSYYSGIQKYGCHYIDQFINYDDIKYQETTSYVQINSNSIRNQPGFQSITAAAFGEPHIMAFSQDLMLINEIGDFFLIQLSPPRMGSNDCFEKGFLTNDQFQLSQILEENENNSSDLITYGVQIRFLPGIWDIEMTQSIALAISLGNKDVIEIKQLLNEPDFDFEIFVNGVKKDINDQNIINIIGHQIQRVQTQQLAGTKGGIQITNKWFNIIWSPFSVIVKLDMNLIQINGQGDACTIDTKGLVGSWSRQKNYYKNTSETFLNKNDYSSIREFANSWRVNPREAIISNWIPEYSQNDTLSHAPKILDPFNPDYLNALKKCNDSLYPIVYVQIELLQFCMNNALYKLKNTTETIIDGCAYDLWVTKNDNFIQAARQLLQSAKNPEPIPCISPNILFKEKYIEIPPQKSIKLQIFESNQNIINQIQIPGVIFKMQCLDNSTQSNELQISNETFLNLKFNQNTSSNNYSFACAGYFTTSDENEIILQSNGTIVPNRPGISLSSFIVNFLSQSSDQNSQDKGNSDWIIITIIVSSSVILIFCVIYYLYYRNKKQQEQLEFETYDELHETHDSHGIQ